MNRYIGALTARLKSPCLLWTVVCMRVFLTNVAGGLRDELFKNTEPFPFKDSSDTHTHRRKCRLLKVSVRLIEADYKMNAFITRPQSIFSRSLFGCGKFPVLLFVHPCLRNIHTWATNAPFMESNGKKPVYVYFACCPVFCSVLVRLYIWLGL